MPLLRTLNRAAFICNLCFLLAIGMLHFNHPVDPGIASLIIVLGFAVSILLNIVVNLCLFILRIYKRTNLEIPRWLIYVNGFFMIVQLLSIIR